MNTPAMQSCPVCRGAVFAPGQPMMWGGPICHCGTSYDWEKEYKRMPTAAAHASGFQQFVPWTMIIESLNKILAALDRLERK